MEIAYCGYDCSTCLGWIAYQIEDKNEQMEYLKNHSSEKLTSTEQMEIVKRAMGF